MQEGPTRDRSRGPPPAVTPTAERNKIQGLEGLRALMAWWVILGHLTLTLEMPVGLINKNTLAVDVFIVLSGFVIFLLIDTKREPYLAYLVRRAFRIFPLYLVVLCASVVLLPLYAEALADFPYASDINAVRSTLTREGMSRLAAHLLLHIPLLQGLAPSASLPDAAFTLVGQAWSVSLEWQFYLVAPLVYFAVRNSKWWIPFGAALAEAFMLTGSFSAGFLGAKELLFAVGIASYFEIAKAKRLRPGAWPVFSLFFAALAVLAGGPKTAIPLTLWFIAVYSSIGHGHVLALWVRRLLGSRTLVYFGQRSYSAYLVHMIPLSTGMYLLDDRGLSRVQFSAALILWTIVSTALLSHWTFRVIERPGTELGARLAERVRERHSLVVARPAG